MGSDAIERPRTTGVPDAHLPERETTMKIPHTSHVLGLALCLTASDALAGQTLVRTSLALPLYAEPNSTQDTPRDLLERAHYAEDHGHDLAAAKAGFEAALAAARAAKDTQVAAEAETALRAVRVRLGEIQDETPPPSEETAQRIAELLLRAEEGEPSDRAEDLALYGDAAVRVLTRVLQTPEGTMVALTPDLSAVARPKFAAYALGIIDSPSARAALLDAFRSATDPILRRAIAQTGADGHLELHFAGAQDPVEAIRDVSGSNLFQLVQREQSTFTDDPRFGGDARFVEIAVERARAGRGEWAQMLGEVAPLVALDLLGDPLPGPMAQAITNRLRYLPHTDDGALDPAELRVYLEVWNAPANDVQKAAARSAFERYFERNDVGAVARLRAANSDPTLLEAVSALATEYSFDATAWTLPYLGLDRAIELLGNLAARGHRLDADEARKLQSVIGLILAEDGFRAQKSADDLARFFDAVAAITDWSGSDQERIAGVNAFEAIVERPASARDYVLVTDRIQGFDTAQYEANVYWIRRFAIRLSGAVTHSQVQFETVPPSLAWFSNWMLENGDGRQIEAAARILERSDSAVGMALVVRVLIPRWSAGEISRDEFSDTLQRLTSLSERSDRDGTVAFLLERARPLLQESPIEAMGEEFVQAAIRLSDEGRHAFLDGIEPLLHEPSVAVVVAYRLKQLSASTRDLARLLEVAEFLPESHNHILSDVIDLLGRALYEPSIDLIGEALRSTDSQVRSAARGALEQFRLQREALEEFDRWKRAKDEAKETTDALVALLDSGDRDVVLGAVEALGAVRAKTALPKLVALLSQDDDELKAAVRAAIARIGE